MTPDDAKAAVDAGADAIVVSNHGGRQLDAGSSSINMLNCISNKVLGQTKVLLDGGIRNGVDVVKALCLGADAVMLGRPWVYAMAAQGQAGIDNLLSVFKNEIKASMGLMGVNSIEELNSDLIADNKAHLAKLSHSVFNKSDCSKSDER